jgi:hypothetical protein
MGKCSGGHRPDYPRTLNLVLVVCFDTGDKDKGDKDDSKGWKPGAEGILSRDCHPTKV